MSSVAPLLVVDLTLIPQVSFSEAVFRNDPNEFSYNIQDARI